MPAILPLQALSTRAIFALERRDRLHRMCATDCLHACFRKAEMLDLALLNQFLHRASHIFDRHVGINPVLIEQVDDVRPEPLERGFGDFLDVLRTAVQPPSFARSSDRA